MASDFSKRMKIRGDQIANGITERMRRVGNEAGQSLVSLTPVLTGLARSNWQASTGTPKTGNVAVKSEGGTVSSIRAVTSTLKRDQDLYISNNLDYIALLNRGHSPKQPVPGWFEAAAQAARGAGSTVKVLK